MTKSIQLLKQIRAITSAVAQATNDTNHKTILSVADVFLNELMLQDASAFYLDFLKQGSALLAEGKKLAANASGKLSVAHGPRSELNIESRTEAIDAEIEVLFASLLAVVRLLDEARSVEEKSWLSRVSLWEQGFYTRSLKPFTPSMEGHARPITEVDLLTYLNKQFPHWKDLKVTKFVPLEGGISKKTILFETLDVVNGAQAMVIRAEQPVNLLHFDGCDIALEFSMIQLMQKHGMPIAEPLWLETDVSHLGARFIVSRKAAGKPIGGNFGSYEPLTAGQLDSYLSNFYKLHSIRPDPNDPLVKASHLNDWMPHQSVRDAAQFMAVERLPLMIQRSGIATTPQMARALRWLEKNVPDCDEPSVIVHTDYAYNNMIFDGGQMTALLDWETSRLGDPADDLIWTQVNLGLYPMPEFVKMYNQSSGRNVTEYRVAYAHLMKCVINLIAGRTGARAINDDDNAPPHMGLMAYKYMPMIGSNIDGLIAAAESANGR